MNTQNNNSNVTDFVKYLYLALTGYGNKDIITAYGIDKKLSSEDIKKLIIKYPTQFGEFCKEIGLAESKLQIALYNYLSNYSMKDFICKYSEIELEQTREQYNYILQMVKKYNIDEIVTELEKLAKYEDINVSENLNRPEENLVISSDETITTNKEVTAKSVVIKELNVDSSTLKVNSNQGNITISNYNSTGDLPKSTSNAQVLINDVNSQNEGQNNTIKINDSNFNMTGYNCIEIGLSTSENNLPKNVYIENLDFNATLSNNAILIFGTQNNAYIQIKNCHFSDVSNCVRLSNKINASGVVCDFINCTCDKWDTNETWAGFLILQDYTSGSKKKEEENNLFSPEKIKINFINCSGPNGKLINNNLSEVCGSNVADKQVVYVWNSYGGSISYDDGSRYPTITFR